MTITGAAISIYVSLLPDSYVVIKGKFEQWRMKWINAEASKRPNTAVTALDDVDIFFPNISILLHILATLASSTLQAERVFSTTDRTLTAFRSTMTELRLEAPVLLNRRPGPQGLLHERTVTGPAGNNTTSYRNQNLNITSTYKLWSL